MAIEILLFGQPQILYNGIPQDIHVKKAVALLAYLATTGKPHSRERLATLFWPESREDVGRTSLRQIMQTLRESPLADVLITDRTSIGLQSDVSSDVQRFGAYIKNVDYQKVALPLAVIMRLQAAETLYRADFMQDFSLTGNAEWEDWQGLRRIEFQYHAAAIVATLTRYYTQEGLADSGLQVATRWLEMDPYNEEAHYFAMHLYMLQQRAESALEQYHLLVRLLGREYGRTPHEEIRQLYDQIRQGQYKPVYTAAPSDRAPALLLPRPIYGATVRPQDRSTLHHALGITSPHAAFCVLVYAEQPNITAAFIATLAHDEAVHAAYPDGILWASLTTADDFEAIMRLWLDALRISVLKSTSKTEHLAWQFHNGQRGKRLLFLLENITDSASARLLIPAYSGCTLVLTTSRHEVLADLASHASYTINLNATV